MKNILNVFGMLEISGLECLKNYVPFTNDNVILY